MAKPENRSKLKLENRFKTKQPKCIISLLISIIEVPISWSLQVLLVMVLGSKYQLLMGGLAQRIRKVHQPIIPSIKVYFMVLCA